MLRHNAIGVLAGLLLATTGCGALVMAERPFALAADWQQFEKIVVHARNGAVDVEPDAGANVRVDGRIRAGGLTLMEANDNLAQVDVTAAPQPGDASTLLIQVEFPDALRNKSVGADMTIRLPAACPATVDSSNGRIRAAGLRGEVVLNTSNGHIDATGIDGRVSADTSNGRIEARDIRGDLVADTSNGRIIVDGIAGRCELRTSNGRVTVTRARGDVAVVTSNGAVQVEADPGPKGSIVVHTSNGGVQLDVPRALSADLMLETSNGAIDATLSDVPLRVRHWGKRRVEAVMNDGGGQLSAISSNGSISLRCH